MAVFDPVVAPTQDPSFTRDSTGVRPEDNLKPRGLEEASIKPKGITQADESSGMLYKSIGQGITGAAGLIDFAGKAVDTILKDSIDKRLTVSLDAEKDRYVGQLSGYYGTPAAAAGRSGTESAELTSQGGSPSGLPIQADNVPNALLKDLPDQMDVLVAARDNGKMSPTFYYAKINELAKSYRTQYPGQRDFIDGIVSKRTGVNPANALITSLTADVNAAAESLKGERAKTETFLRQHLGMPGVADKLSQYRAGLITADDADRHVSKYLSMEYYFKTKSLERDWEKGGREDQALSDGKDFDFVGVTSVSTAFDNIAIPAGVDGSPSKIIDLLRDIDQGKRPRPDSTQFQVMGAALKREREQMASYLTNHAYKQGYGKTIGGKGIEDRINHYLANWDRTTELIMNEKYGQAFYAARFVKSKSDDNVSQFLSEVSLAETNMIGQGLRHTFGDQYMGQVATDQLGKGIMTKIDTLMKNYGDKIRLQPNLPGSSGFNQDFSKLDPTKAGQPYTFFEQVMKMKEKGIVDAKAYDYFVDMIGKEFVNPNTPDGAKMNIATAAFADPKGKSLIDIPWVDKNGNSMRGAIFARMSNNDVRDTVLKLSKENPAIWNGYTNFVDKSFNSLFTTDVLSLNDATTSPRIKVAWDSPNNAFRLMIDGKDVTEKKEIPPVMMATQKAMNRVNFAMKSVKGIAEKIDGFDIEAYLLRSLEGMGLDPTKKGIAESMPQAFLDAVMSSRVKATMQSKDEKKKWQSP